MRREKLTTHEIADALAGLTGWSEKNGKLEKSYKFENFAASLAFVNRVGEIAEQAAHHPDITLGWGYADIATTTHDRGGITDHDVSLAKKIDEIDR